MKKVLFLIFLFTFFLNVSFSQSINGLINLNFSWQAINSYVPAFYDGRALPGEQSSIKIVSNIVLSKSLELDKDSLYYDWYINDVYSSDYSGQNKSSLIFDLDQTQSTNKVTLKVYSDKERKNLLIEKSVNVSPYSNFALIYKDDGNPFVNMNKALNKKFSSLILNKLDSLNIRVEPFYYSIKDPLESKLSYTLTKNSISTIQKSKNTYQIKTPEYQYGDISLGIKIENSKEFLQTSNTIFNINLNTQ